MPKLDLATVPLRTGTIYPAPYAVEVEGRSSLRLGQAGGLTQFGVNLVILSPGAKSSLRHWHLNEDEFVMILSGDCTLVEDAGPVPMHPGDCAAFQAGLPDGHHFINHTDVETRFLVIGTKAASEVVTYPDVDLRVEQAGGVNRFTRRDGTPLPDRSIP